MLRIDNTLLQEIGLGSLPDAEKNSLLKHIYDTLEMRVGMRLADQMTNEQLDEFERYYESKDDAGAFKWLETNFPNYKDIVQEEFDKLKAEVAQSAPQILSASQAQQAQPQPGPIPTDPANPAVVPPPSPQSQPSPNPVAPPPISQTPQPEPIVPPVTPTPEQPQYNPEPSNSPDYPNEQPPPGPAATT